jgi:chromosome partitioning protein
MTPSKSPINPPYIDNCPSICINLSQYFIFDKTFFLKYILGVADKDKFARILAFTNWKGGVGKTTTCVNLSAYLVEAGKKVLVVDLDPQGNASLGLGIAPMKSKTVYDLMCDDCDISDAVQLTTVSGLEIIPADVNLAGAEEELVRMQGRERILKTILDKARPSYDYICIDCPPSLGLLPVNALTAADALIIPIQCEFYAMEGIAQLMYTIKLIKKHYNPELTIDGVLLTMENRGNLTEQVAAEIMKYFGKIVFKTRIPRNVRLAEAPSYGKPISLYDKRCTGAKAYQNLCKEVLARHKSLKNNAQGKL